MKNLLLLIAMTVSVHSFAQEVVVEFDQSQEVQCLQEAKSLGCASDSEEDTKACLEKNQKKLSKTCRDMHTAKTKAQTQTQN